LRRAIEHYLEDPLAEDLLHGRFAGKDTITVRVREEGGEKKLYFEATASSTPELVGAGSEGKG
jgi:ATP-dependent Clp protease ATP-binding subunit ClpA